MARNLTSTQLCQQLEISTKTLYLWERSGKIPKPGRDRRGWRVFSPRQVEVIRKFARPAMRTELRREARLDARARTPDSKERNGLTGLTARNQLRGEVISVTSDGLLSEIVLRLGDGQEIVAVVTRSSVRRLGLRRGQEAMAVIKATEVMLFT